MSSTSADTPSFAGSSILRQSPPFHSPADTDPAADLSLSELYISDRSEDVTVSKPFTLVPPRGEGCGEAGCDDDLNEVNHDTVATDKGKSSLSTARSREERLQHDLFVLKKLNASFSLYNDALKDTRSSTENVALQLDRTDRLLDQYVNLLRHTENHSKLIFDETWEGGVMDQEILDKLRAESAQKAQREREERENAARKEQERLENEELARKARELRDANERGKRGSGSVRGVRGVRGLRARGAERGSSVATRGTYTTGSSAMTNKGGGPVVSSRGSTASRGRHRS
ncbi:hypothetical protein JB92DRAFT_2920224 [Gautieria morchelliformis]|nr:hypothetical protein JB92DRAFT_2920224 [Gautieria morchelliformis]